MGSGRKASGHQWWWLMLTLALAVIGGAGNLSEIWLTIICVWMGISCLLALRGWALSPAEVGVKIGRFVLASALAAGGAVCFGLCFWPDTSIDALKNLKIEAATPPNGAIATSIFTVTNESSEDLKNVETKCDLNMIVGNGGTEFRGNTPALGPQSREEILGKNGDSLSEPCNYVFMFSVPYMRDLDCIDVTMEVDFSLSQFADKRFSKRVRMAAADYFKTGLQWRGQPLGGPWNATCAQFLGNTIRNKNLDKVF